MISIKYSSLCVIVFFRCRCYSLILIDIRWVSMGREGVLPNDIRLMISFHYSKLLAELSSTELKNMELSRKKFSVLDRPNEMCLIQTKLVILIILCLFEPIYCQILSVGNFETLAPKIVRIVG